MPSWRAAVCCRLARNTPSGSLLMGSLGAPPAASCARGACVCQCVCVCVCVCRGIAPVVGIAHIHHNALRCRPNDARRKVHAHTHVARTQHSYHTLHDRGWAGCAPHSVHVTQAAINTGIPCTQCCQDAVINDKLSELPCSAQCPPANLPQVVPDQWPGPLPAWPPDRQAAA